MSLEKAGEGFRITRSALTLRAEVPGIERAKFQELAMAAKENCPVSKALDTEITLDWTLA